MIITLPGLKHSYKQASLKQVTITFDQKKSPSSTAGLSFPKVEKALKEVILKTSMLSPYWDVPNDLHKDLNKKVKCSCRMQTGEFHMTVCFVGAGLFFFFVCANIN